MNPLFSVTSSRLASDGLHQTGFRGEETNNTLPFIVNISSFILPASKRRQFFSVNSRKYVRDFVLLMIKNMKIHLL